MCDDWVRARADGNDDRIHLHVKLRALDGDWAAAARSVGLTEFHADATQALDPAVLIAEHFDRVRQQLEVDALFLGVLNFFRARRDLRLTAAVDDGDLLRAEAQRRAGSIHRDIAAADDGDMAADLDRRRVFRELVGLHEIAAREEFIGRVDAVEALARNALEARQAGARADEDGVKALFLHELIDRVEAAGYRVKLDLDAELLDVLDLLLDDRILRQAELRDTVRQHAARLVQGLEDRHIVAFLCKVACAREAGRAGTDDSDFLRIGCALDWLDLFIGSELAVSHEAFEAADGDGLPALREDAVLLALIFLWADATADGRQGIRLLDRRDSAVEVALLDLADEGRDVDGDRATLAALWYLAVQAALCLGHCRLLVVAESDFLKVMGTDFRVLYRHLVFL